VDGLGVLCFLQGFTYQSGIEQVSTIYQHIISSKEQANKNKITESKSSKMSTAMR